MRDLTLVNKNYTRQPKTVNSQFKFNVLLVAAVVILCATYLFELSALSTKGYEIRQIEVSLKKLETEHKHLEVQVSSLQSINRIQLEAEKFNFVPATNITYIKGSDFALNQ